MRATRPRTLRMRYCQLALLPSLRTTQVRERLPYVSLHLPISPRCENDFQLDIATAEGRAEYKRIVDRAAELGLEQVRGWSTLGGC